MYPYIGFMSENLTARWICDINWKWDVDNMADKKDRHFQQTRWEINEKSIMIV